MRIFCLFKPKETDLETGLQYFGARYYMPHLGRWLANRLAGRKALQIIVPFKNLPIFWILNRKKGASSLELI